MDKSTWTQVKDIKQTYDVLNATFLSGKTRPISWRKDQIRALGCLVQENTEAFCAALTSDLGRPHFETITGELEPLKNEINEVLSSLDRWAKPERVSTVWMWKAAKPTIYKEPKGVVAVLSAWNFPITLLLGPLLGAISAGCTCLLKPSELAPSTASLVASLLPRYLDPSAFACVLGGVPQTTELLSLKYQHVFYTGSGKVGRIVARAAAEHLCPTTLELGGKSPAVVLEDADVEVAARRIMWAKYTNAGQICIAPDYILTTPTLEPKLISALKRSLATFSAPAPSASASASAVSASTSDAPPSLLTSPSYSRIVSPTHFKRLSKLLDETKGEVVIGGGRSEAESAQRKIEVTIVRGVKGDDALMSEEIFGPILPIMTLKDKDEMVEFIKAGETPLAIYLFTQSEKESDYVFSRTRSGTFLQNDTLVQFMMPGLPFGGTGESGYGGYHGKRSFDTFTHERAAASVPTWMDTAMAARYPPYTPGKLRFLLLATGASLIPKPRHLGGSSSRFFSLFGFGLPLPLLLKLIAIVGAAWAVVKGRAGGKDGVKSA